MPELGPMMRALELQRLIEDKVSEWRERSARVAGATVADAYQQPLNFKRHTHRRKNSAEINRIIAKYSRPYKTTDESRYTTRRTPENPPTRPPRKKSLASLKILSKSEDNLTTVGFMEVHPEPTGKTTTLFSVSKYNAKSCEDVTAFVDVNVKSKNFEPRSILNAKVISSNTKPKLHSISEDVPNNSSFKDSAVELRFKSDFVTSTPLACRKKRAQVTSMSELGFEKCFNYSTSACDIRKGVSEPDILSANNKELSEDTKNIAWRKRWKQLKPPFKKGTFDCLLRWRGNKTKQTPDVSRR